MKQIICEFCGMAHGLYGIPDYLLKLGHTYDTHVLSKTRTVRKAGSPKPWIDGKVYPTAEELEEIYLQFLREQNGGGPMKKSNVGS